MGLEISKLKVPLIAVLVLAAIVLMFSAGNREIEMTEKMQPGYRIGVRGQNSSLLMHRRRNATAYSLRFAKERRAKAAIRNAKTKIYNEWAVRQYPLFLATAHIPTQSWSAFKYRFLKLMIEHELKNTSKFVMGFAGSSMTHSLGNSSEETYPALLDRTLRPFFDALGIKFEVRNGGSGKREECFPYDICAAAHLGDDVDFIVWEQSPQCAVDGKSTEIFIRSSVELAHNPMLMITAPFTALGKQSACPASIFGRQHPPHQEQVQDSSLRSRIVSPSPRRYNRTSPLSRLEAGLLRMPLAVTANRTEQLLASAPFLASHGMNFLSYYGDYVAIGFQNVAGTIAAYNCEGPYSAKVNYNRSITMPSLGQGEHRLRADTLAYVLLDLLRSALELLMVAPRKRGLLKDANAYLRAHNVMASTSGSRRIPISHSVDTEVNSPLTNAASSFYKRAKLVDPLACDRGVCGSGSSRHVCYTNYISQSKYSLADRLVRGGTAEYSGWQIVGSQVSDSHAPGAIFADEKHFYVSPTAPSANDAISFELNVATTNASVLLCEVTPRVATHGQLQSDASVAITLNVPAAVSRTTLFADGKAGRLLPLTAAVYEGCYRTVTIPSGRHFLTVWSRSPSVQCSIPDCFGNVKYAPCIAPSEYVNIIKYFEVGTKHIIT